MSRKFFLSLTLVAVFLPAFVFAQPPRRDDGHRFSPPQHASRDRYAIPPQSLKSAPQVHVPQRSYDRFYHHDRYRSDYGYTYYRPLPPYPPVYPVRPGVVVIPAAVDYYNYGYYDSYGNWINPYRANGFSITVGGRNGSISVTGIQ
ncbi:MAG: hypothetical protein FWC50_03170 [Planctomycetaceae bacterium]|nr:hypothetical protein [Planctomycetaceae bacterium]